MTSRPPFPTHIDSTMLAAFRSCPMKMYREYILHYKPREPSVHLHAGGAFARGLEVARASFYEQGLPSEDSIALGMNALLQAYGNFDCPIDSPKSLERMAGAFEFYFDRYPLETDSATPYTLPDGSKAIEFSFAEPLPITHPQTGDPLIYCGRSDMIADFAGGTYIFDDKTASSLGPSWARQWEMRSQFTGYCVTPDTEVLTLTGWKPIPSLIHGESVATWANGSIWFDTPTDYIEMDYAGAMTEFDGKVHICATPEHRQVVFDTYAQEYKTYLIRDLPRNSGSLRFISAGVKDDGENLSASAIRLLVALQADGSWGDGTAMRFHFTKSAKARRLEGLFQELELPYSKHDTQDGSYSYRVPTGTLVGQALYALLGPEKLFGDWLLKLSGAALAIFVEELQHWDGSSRGTRGWMYFTSIPSNADWVRTAAALCGHYTSMHTQTGWKTAATAYRVNITKGNMHSVHLTEERQVPYKGKVYCLTVPSSYFLIRSKGRIMVTGNCWAAAQCGIPINGVLVRGISILKTKYDTQQAITSRAPWELDRWYAQTCKDLQRMIRLWESSEWDYSLDHACAEYGGCIFTQACKSPDPQPWLDLYFTQRVWDPLTREETLLGTPHV